MTTLRAAVITDIHYGIDTKDKLGSKAPRLTRQFVKAANQYGPAFVVEMGDRISATSPDSDRKYMKELKKQFNKLAAPLHSVLGNHDLRHLSRRENAQIMGSPSVSYSHDKDGRHFVFWNPKFHITEDGLELEKKDMDWLRNDLNKAKGKPAVLFTHVPLDNLNGEESDDITKYFFWSQGADVRKILEDTGNVVLCMHGHRHRNRHREINGIHYITQQSFTSQWRAYYRIPSRTWSMLELDDDKITVKLQGKFKKTYDLTPRPVAP